MLPTKIKHHKASNTLEITYSDSSNFELSAEFLRVHSPSAEVKGHGPGQEVLQHGKKDVAIQKIERAGNYALRLFFDDGHDSGIYTWDYLYTLANNQQSLWQQYLSKLHRAGKHREPDIQVVQIIHSP
ncbi:gamma-butyrobetaine hydroxylase-like domain-containing protein [Porticoccus sp. GXU_MW_L64]